MVGKFLKRAAIVDTIKSEHRINAIRRRKGLMRYPVRGFACGCPDENCGAFHVIMTENPIPTTEEAGKLLRDHQRRRKYLKHVRKARMTKARFLERES